MSSIFRPVGIDQQPREPARLALDASRYSMQPSVLAAMLHDQSDDEAQDTLDVPRDAGLSSGSNSDVPPVPPTPRIAVQPPPRSSSSAPPPHGMRSSLRQLQLDPARREVSPPPVPSPPSSPLPEPPKTPARQTGPSSINLPPPPTTPVAQRVSTPYPQAPRQEALSAAMQRAPASQGSTLSRRRGVRLEPAQVVVPASPTQSDSAPGDVVLEVFGPGQTLLARVRYVGGQP